MLVKLIKKTGYAPINIAIVDAGGDLVLFRRQNDAFLLSIDIATKKAISSAGIPFPTRLIEELVYGKDKKGGIIPGLAFSKNIVAFAGGLPIKTKDGILLGAIGISGATADEDEQCAAAAIKAVENIFNYNFLLLIFSTFLSPPEFLPVAFRKILIVKIILLQKLLKSINI